MNRAAFLRNGREPLQIHVPEDFAGKRSSDEEEIYLCTHPIVLTDDEIQLAREFCEKLLYPQQVVTGAVFIDEDDLLINATHERLNQVEKEAGLPNTEFASKGGQRSTFERVLLIREIGYEGNGSKQLTAVD